ncbi:MAG TPA: PilZ domain-containing protein [Polyangiaceae bacterium]|nr:PilZ domain-containing protein [Polyangiaceae bacterium]
MSSSSDPPDAPRAPCEGDGDRRSEREPIWFVDCDDEGNFLYASLSNISALGIFIRTLKPLGIGMHVTLRFAPRDMGPFTLSGQVQWLNPLRVLGDNPNPGMGVRLVDLSYDDRERVVQAVRTIAYLREAAS